MRLIDTDALGTLTERGGSAMYSTVVLDPRPFIDTAVTSCITASVSEIDELREEIERLRTRQAHAIVCGKCGGSFEFRGENGVCPYCDTHYSTRIVMEEMNKRV